MSRSPRTPRHAPAEHRDLIRQFVEEVPASVAMFDREMRYIMVSRRFVADYHLEPQELVGRSHYEVFPDIPDRWKAIHRRCLAGAIEKSEEDPFPRGDGSLDWVRWEIQPWREPDGTIGGIILFSEVITERKRMEQALRERENQYRLLFRANPQPMWVYDLETLRFLAVNDAAIDHYGYSEAEFARMTIRDIRPEEDVPALLQHLAKGSPTLDHAGIWRHRKKDGSVIAVEITSHLLEFAGRPAELVMAQDVTARRQAEEDREKLQAQLLQAQKLESVGRLAGGVAHDFNNVLTAILGETELLLDRLPEPDPARPSLEQIRDSALRSANITRQLLAFARRQTIRPVVLDLNEAVENTLKMLRRLIGEDIDLVWRPDPATSPIEADPSQIDQLLANLCLNARDAIDGVGRIRIATGNVTLDEPYCAEHPGLAPGNFVRLEVSDDGRGMDRATLDHIFEPFFTTKEVGQGTGLGLATVFGIVKQNDGLIDVRSEPGAGTSFAIYFVPSAGEIREERPASRSAGPMGHGETVLLVEDDRAILRLAQVTLERLGYTVLAAVNPAEALALADGHRDPIDLLLTDVIMPEMNGRELSARLSERHPRMATLFMSGYPADVVAHQGVLAPGVRIVQKPFSIGHLASRARETLDDR